MTLADVLTYGAIVASDPETGALVTANGAYLNLWVSNSETDWENVDVRSYDMASGVRLTDLSLRELTRRAESWLDSLDLDRAQAVSDAMGGN